MPEFEEAISREEVPKSPRKAIDLGAKVGFGLDADAKAELRRYWRRDVPLSAIVVFPLIFAFDQSLRFGLMNGWVAVNLFTAFVLRPALTYLAGRSLFRWLRMDWRGFGFLIASYIALDAKAFRIPPEHAAIAAVSTGFVLFIVEVLIDCRPDPKKRESLAGPNAPRL